jgi:hypothetical protein
MMDDWFANQVAQRYKNYQDSEPLREQDVKDML